MQTWRFWTGVVLAAVVLGGCSQDGDSPLPGPQVPLAPGSPWPKFRGNARQTGHGFARPRRNVGPAWDVRTGKGIFSTPVVGTDGTVYVGSADRVFYAFYPDGTERWRFQTGEIIDSSALLDDLGRIYFGSGDGRLYALDAATGEPVWTFEADPPSVNGAFINWFEGNVAIGPDGTLYIPNDNFFVYAIDRESGEPEWKATMPDQTWSLPAVNPENGNLFFGNNNLLEILGANTYALDANGDERWTASSNGTIAASPLLTSDGKVILGGYDGFVRAYGARRGNLLWEFGARDHVYASPAEAADGTIIQPACDGTIYALDPEDGSVRWAFDTLEAVRSSPAIDADGRIYVGSGEGRLFVLEPDGTLRWSIRLIDEERNDLNASPALGEDAIYIAGESGQVFRVPYDYCLQEEDPRCAPGTGEDLPAEGVFLLYTSQLGAPLDTPPETIDANQILAFSLFVREAGDTRLALIDSNSLQVTMTPATAIRADVSGDRRFLTVLPLEPFRSEGGAVTVRIDGRYLVDPERDGLKFSGGSPGGTFDETFSFSLRGAGQNYPVAVPAAPGDPATVWELYRLAAPLPTIMPSYNQIGFDSLHYLIGVVEGEPGNFIAWVCGARLAAGEDRTEIDPDTTAMFPLVVTMDDGLVTMVNEAGFGMGFNGFTLVLNEFRLAARLDEQGRTLETPRILVNARCSDMSFYGPFMQTLGLCNTQTDMLTVYGAALFRPHQEGTQQAPAGLGTVTFEPASDRLVARIEGSSLPAAEHAFGILLVDEATGAPVSLGYGLSTRKEPDAQDMIATVEVEYERDQVPDRVRAHLMVDTCPAAVATVDIPDQ